MSWEGYTEQLCERGHYSVENFMPTLQRATCRLCGSRIEFECIVDTTNGAGEEEYEGSHPGAKEEIGFNDKWMVNHYGNKYAVKQMQYRPASPRWRNVWIT